MTRIKRIAKKYNLPIVEDATQAAGAKYKEKYLGTISTFGTYSFHETKNFICGECRALVINDSKFIERAEFIREKGTNRSKFFRGEVDKYSWVDMVLRICPPNSSQHICTPSSNDQILSTQNGNQFINTITKI